MDFKAEYLRLSSDTTKKKSIILIISLLLIIILLLSTIIVGIKLISKSSKYDDLKKDYLKLETKYNNLENKYENQNNTINDIFNTFQDLIANTTMPSTTIKKEDYKNTKSELRKIKNYDDGTYNFITKEEINYEKGFHVSFETKSRYYEIYYSDEEYDNIVFKIASLLGVNADLGVYNKNPQISFYIEDKELALSIAALFNQESIWDWSQNKIILNPLHQPKYY